MDIDLTPFAEATGRIEVLRHLCAAAGIECPDAWGADVRPAFADILERLGPRSNRSVAFRSSAELGLHPRLVAARDHHRLKPPLHVNGRPDCFPPTPMAWSPDVRLLELEDGIICHFADGPLILTGDGTHVVSDYSSRLQGVIHYYAADLRKIIDRAPHIRGTVLCLADDIRPLNYSHWVLDWLPRLAFLGDQVRRPDFHVVTTPLVAPFQAESLALCGITRDRILPLEEFDAVQADRLLVSSDLPSIPHPAFQGAPWAIAYLRSALAWSAAERQPDAVAPAKVYVSRGDVATRRVSNEAALLDYLRPRGYQAMSFAGMSFIEQVRALARATHVVAPHGAGLTNFVFSGHGCRLIELFPRTYGTPAYYVIAARMQREYASFIAEVTQPTDIAVHDDMEVDIAAFDASCGALL